MVVAACPPACSDGIPAIVQNGSISRSLAFVSPKKHLRPEQKIFMIAKHLHRRPTVRSRRPAILGTSIAAAVALCLTPGIGRGQTWTGASDGNWNNAANWNPATVPNSFNATATFGVSGTTTISLSSTTTIGNITFSASATSPYTLDLAPTNASTLELLINGTGITNNSGATQNFVTASDAQGGNGLILFEGSASAGTLTQFTNQGGTNTSSSTQFIGSSTAGSAVINNLATTTSSGLAGFTAFSQNATAGSATINNQGATVSNGAAGSTSFLGSSTAGSATIVTNGGTAGNAGANTSFHNSADGGTARAITNGNGVFDISGLFDGGMKIGSIEGSGTYELGGNTLTVGGNNRSTTVSGTIEDGGQFSGFGGSLVKTGTGTLTLTGANTYTGTTTINGGLLQVNGSLASTAPVMVNSTGTLGGMGTIAGAVTVNSGGILAHGNSFTPQTLTVGGLTLNTGSNLDYELTTPGTAGGGINDLTIVNGDLNLGGTLNITGFSGFGAGTYELFTSTGAFTEGAFNFGTLPSGYSAANFTLQTSTLHEVDLIVTNPALQYWNGPINGDSGNWNNTLTNWTDSVGATSQAWAQYVAVFDGITGKVNVTDNITANGLSFGAGAGAYTVSITAGQSLSVGSAGLANTSGVVQNFITNAAGNQYGQITFANGATVGSLTQFTNQGGTISSGHGGQVTFNDVSSAGGATIINNSGTVNGANAGSTVFNDAATPGQETITNRGATLSRAGSGLTTFNNSATAGSAAITNQASTISGTNGGVASFANTSTAGGATITNNGGAVSGAEGGSAQFADSATAGSATIINQSGAVRSSLGGLTFFSNTATAGSATINNHGGTVSGALGGTTEFFDSATAGSATIITSGGTGGGGGGVTFFYDSADGGTARAITTGNGAFNISNLTNGGMNIGSIEGSGSYVLGGNALTVGGNNLSTTVSGVIQDGSDSTGGALVKVGTGTLTLTAANTYTGSTTINAGVLAVNGSLTQTISVAVNNGGTLAGTGTIAAPVTLFSGGTLAHGLSNSPATLTLGTLTLNSGSIIDYQLGAPGTFGGGVNDLTVVNGSLTLGGTLNIAGLACFGDGTYELFSYTGSLTGSTFNFGTLPAGFIAADFTIQTSVPNQVDLIVTGGPVVQLQYWNGMTTAADGAIHGGPGTWDNVTTNWTEATGTASAAWAQSTAIFSAGAGTVTLGDNITAGALSFVNGAGAYSVQVPGGFTLTISGAGVTNTSALTQNFVTAVNGIIAFTNNASAGNLTTYTNNGPATLGVVGGSTTFSDNSTAGTATFVNQGGGGTGLSGGYTLFTGNSTAAGATISNQPGSTSDANGGYTIFPGNSTAANATIDTNGGAMTSQNGANTYFKANSTAGSATINNYGGSATNAQGGLTTFQDSATAAGASIINWGGSALNSLGGGVQFQGTSTAGSAMIQNQGSTVDGSLGGVTTFTDPATAANATINNNSGAADSAGGGATNFLNTSTAGNATISNNAALIAGAGAGTTNFLNMATAGAAVINNQASTITGVPAGTLVFSNTATAGSATISYTSGTVSTSTTFNNSSTAGNATISNLGGTVTNAPRARRTLTTLPPQAAPRSSTQAAPWTVPSAGTPSFPMRRPRAVRRLPTRTPRLTPPVAEVRLISLTRPTPAAPRSPTRAARSAESTVASRPFKVTLPEPA